MTFVYCDFGLGDRFLFITWIWCCGSSKKGNIWQVWSRRPERWNPIRVWQRWRLVNQIRIPRQSRQNLPSVFWQWQPLRRYHHFHKCLIINCMCNIVAAMVSVCLVSDFYTNDIPLLLGGLLPEEVKTQDPPIERDLHLSLDDLFHGCTKKIKISRRVSFFPLT